MAAYEKFARNLTHTQKITLITMTFDDGQGHLKWWDFSDICHQRKFERNKIVTSQCKPMLKIKRKIEIVNARFSPSNSKLIVQRKSIE